MLITQSIEGYGGLVLTIAYPLPAKNTLLKDACFAIVAGLEQYNLEKTAYLPKRNVFYQINKAQTILVGNICGPSFSIENTIDIDMFATIACKNPQFLALLMAKASEYGAKRAFSWGYKNSELVEIFFRYNFILCGEFPDLEHDRVIQRFYKDIDCHLKFDNQSCITISTDYTYDSYEELNPYHSGFSLNKNSFGVFIQDAKSQILRGGVFGKMLRAEEIGIPHGLIDCLWVHSTYRAKKLGTVLMRESENLFREQGAKYIQLATTGFQAPGFYRKIGFDLSCSAPGYYVLSDGNYDIFDCTKKL